MSVSKNNKNNQNIDTGLQTRLSKDFVVKNMPALSSLSGASYVEENKTETKSLGLKQSLDSGDKHRKTGLMIVSGGIIFIFIIFYLAYRFLISPSLDETNNEINNIASSSVKEESIVPNNQDVDVIVEPIVIEEPVAIVEDEEQDESDNAIFLPEIIDTDGDGLSDESEAFLGSDPQNADTDSDGYSDKQEILNGYNPIGLGSLSENLNLSLFVNTDEHYALIYPRAWSSNIISEKSVLFSAPDQDFVQLSYEDNEIVYSSIIDWYQEQFAEVDTLSEDRLLTSSFGPGIRSADNQFVYFLSDNGSRVFVLSYIPAGETMPYLEIFKMMVSTFMKI